MKKLLYIVFAAAGLGALGWWAYDSQRASSGPAFEVGATARASARPPADPPPSPPAGGPGARGGPGAPVGVEVAQAETVALAETVSAVGTLRAAESVVLRPEIAGRIARIGFEGGARVRRGDLLVALDAAIPLAETEQTRAELELARANYQRTDDLARKQFVSERARDEAAANLQVLEARLKLAQARLSKTEIRAPFGGVLGLRNISVGDFVRDGADLVVLEDVSSMQVDLRLPERFFGQLRRGQPIQIEFDAWPGRQFKALLEAVDAQVDANGRSVIARGRLANADGALRAGMFAKASLTLSEKPGAIMIPEEAVMPTGSELYVYRIEDGKAIRTKILTGQRRGGRVEVVEGLQPDARVVTAGQLKIQRDGQPVRILGAREGPAPAGG